MKRLLVVIVLLVAVVSAVSASSKPSSRDGGNPDVSATEGFRKLRWGISLAAAKKIYPDLCKGDEPNGYIRTSEDKAIANVVFDKISYTFADNRFSGVSSWIERPWDHRDEPIAAMDDIRKYIEVKYGIPSSHIRKPGRVTDEEEIIWLLKGVRIRLHNMGIVDDNSSIFLLLSISM